MKMKYVITESGMEIFRKKLIEEEKGKSTIEKYMRDIRKLYEYFEEREINKELLIQYKDYLKNSGKYKTSGINSFLAVINHYCEIMGWDNIRVKSLKVQKEIFCPEERNLTYQEYSRLINTANRQGKIELALIIQTIGGTGIRISELKYITVDAVTKGTVEIMNKGKIRRIMLPKALQIILRKYVRERHIKKGIIFKTSSGNPLDRSNIWKNMKKICMEARVDDRKVFPHNLRHLFARYFYNIEKDIAKLADVLGHSSIETTRIYIKSTGEEHLRQLNSMRMILTT